MKIPQCRTDFLTPIFMEILLILGNSMDKSLNDQVQLPYHSKRTIEEFHIHNQPYRHFNTLNQFV